MLNICLVIITFAQIAWCENFNIVCDYEIKLWVLEHKVSERPKPNFDAGDISFYLYNNENHGVLLEVGTAGSGSTTSTTPSPISSTTTSGTSQKTPIADSRLEQAENKIGEIKRRLKEGGNNKDDDNLDLIIETENTVFIVHGWFEDYKESWIHNMTELLVRTHGVNVIVVDYNKYSNDFYKASVQVIKDIAIAIANLLKAAVEKNQVKVENTTFIGFGLGAHISGLVGKQIKKIYPDKKLARITGLDPVGFLFDSGLPENLQTSDADFVDVVQTNSDWLGSDVNFGQANFRMNDGKQQPGCNSTGESDLQDKFRNQDCTEAYNQLRCSHLRSTEYWAESVLLNNFVDESGKVMGYKGDIGISGQITIQTNNQPPYGIGNRTNM